MPTMHDALVGSYRRVAELLDLYATVPGVRGVMLTFDDFVEGMDKFGRYIQPLMTRRQHVTVADFDGLRLEAFGKAAALPADLPKAQPVRPRGR